MGFELEEACRGLSDGQDNRFFQRQGAGTVTGESIKGFIPGMVDDRNGFFHSHRLATFEAERMGN